MDFPIVDLLDDDVSTAWLLKYFHSHGLKCPQCQASVRQARVFRRTTRSKLNVYRCQKCVSLYTLYSGTVFAGKHLRPAQTVLLLRGVCKGEPSQLLARELKLSRETVHALRQALQANAQRLQPTTPLNDQRTETDELFQNAGKKGEKHADPMDPPRCRANNQRGHGTYANDRPPIVGTVGRKSGQVRLRVVKHTDGETLRRHVQTFTRERADVNTDEWTGYTRLERKPATVNHGAYEWAREDDGDGIREVHSNTIEGMWTGVRNFLRPFRGVHKRYLSQFVAMCEFNINRKRVTPKFISSIVALH